MDKQMLKKISCLGTAAIIGTIITTSVYAEDATGTGTTGSPDSAVLQQIETNTANTLAAVNSIPSYIAAMGLFITAWMTEDTSDTTATTQTNFSQLGTLMNTNATQVLSMQASLNSGLLTGTTKATLPNSNDLTYSTLLGVPAYTPDGRSGVTPQLNYIKNASGMTLSHPLPNGAWRGTKDDLLRYSNYYNTVMAVESYGGYILSNEYVDGNQYNQLQATMVTQATDANWFATIASENIGWVLRQILMYQSQSFVLMTELVKSQKQMVTAQVMTNAAIIAGNAENESQLVRSAQAS